MSSAKYRRILLKVSGEMLAGEQGYGIQPSDSRRPRGRNRRRRRDWTSKSPSSSAAAISSAALPPARSGMERASADYMGMLATVLNALALQNALERKGVMTRVQSAIEMRQLAEGYIRRRAIRHLEKKRVVIFAGGTGNPYFSTDTAAVAPGHGNRRAGHHERHQGRRHLRRRSGQKSAQPRNTTEIPFLSILTQNLKVMDSTAISLCMDNRLPLIVFNLKEQGKLQTRRPR